MVASFFGRPWDQMGQKCQYLAEKASFGPNFAVFGPKILIFYGSKQKFGTIITEKPPRQLVRTVFWSGIWSNEPKKYRYLAKNVKNPFLGGDGVKLLVPSYEGTKETPFPCRKHWPIDRCGSNWLLGMKMCNFDQKIWIFVPKVNFLYGDRDFLSTEYITSTPGATTLPFRPPQNFIFWGSPLFLAVSGHSHFTIISTLIFGPFWTKLGGTFQAIKKMTQNDNGPGPGQNYGETPF